MAIPVVLLFILSFAYQRLSGFVPIVKGSFVTKDLFSFRNYIYLPSLSCRTAGRECGAKHYKISRLEQYGALAAILTDDISKKMQENSRQQQAKILRIFRKVHRTTGALLFVFFFIVSVTGLLLGWKKHSGGLILAKSYKGASSDLKDWLSIDSLHKNAGKIFRDSISPALSPELERIDIRKDKGMVKFVFTDGFWGIQLDGTTGRLLHIERRRSDFIEKVHDGSVLDYYFNTGNGQIKLVYTSVMGVALLIFTITGFWLWHGPKRMRKTAKR